MMPGRKRATTTRKRRSAAGLASVASVALISSALAACGTSNAANGPVTLSFYLYPDNSGATQQAIKNCDAQSHGKYTISYQELPQASDGQRQQLVRRLAAQRDWSGADAAVANDHRGNTLRNLRQHRWRANHGGVVMSVYIDKARRQHQTNGVQRLSSLVIK